MDKLTKPASIMLAVVVLGAAAVAYYQSRGSGLEQPAVAQENESPQISNAVETAKSQSKPVTKLKIDLASRKVFIPDEGWFETDEFWEIYYQQPERLPGEIDFGLLNQIEQLSAGHDVRSEANPVVMSSDVPSSDVPSSDFPELQVPSELSR